MNVAEGQQAIQVLGVFVAMTAVGVMVKNRKMLAKKKPRRVRFLLPQLVTKQRLIQLSDADGVITDHKNIDNSSYLPHVRKGQKIISFNGSPFSTEQGLGNAMGDPGRVILEEEIADQKLPKPSTDIILFSATKNRRWRSEKISLRRMQDRRFGLVLDKSGSIVESVHENFGIGVGMEVTKINDEDFHLFNATAIEHDTSSEEITIVLEMGDEAKSLDSDTRIHL